MIVAEHVPHLQRLAQYFKPAMLMLGRQSNTARWEFPCKYTTLDLDGGDLKIDLNEFTDAQGFDPLEDHRGRYQTVFNLGTLEHVWDVHSAYVNAASMVAKGGRFICQAPVAGFEGHGIHITDPKRIIDFFQLNGFIIDDAWLTTQAGSPIPAITRNAGKSVLLWFSAQRVECVDRWQKPSQVYTQGKKD